MADLTVTATGVLAASGAGKARGTAGGTITAGQPLYIDSSDSNKLKPCDADASAAAAACVGIALHGAASGQPIEYQQSGDINPGATVTVGESYYVSDTAGGIKPAADLVSGDYVTFLGVGTTASNIKLGLLVSGVAVP